MSHAARLPAPVWMLDAEQLRSGLDRLRDALATPPIVSPMSGAGLAFDRARMTDTLSCVADATRGVDVDARRSLTGVTPAVGLAEETKRLRVLVEQLHAAWVARVRAKLGDVKGLAAAELLRVDAPDLLAIFRKGDDENAHSDVLRWMLDPREAPTLAPAALLALAARFDDAEQWAARVRRGVVGDQIVVRREFVIGRASDEPDDLSRIDLVVWGPDFVIGIENKVWSLEHSEQTQTYWRWLSSLSVAHAGVFLTPAGDHASCADFRCLSYLDLLACLLEAPARGKISPAERTVLAGYVKTLARRILKAELRAVNGGGSHERSE